jgi:hypothetical protein
MNTRSAPPLATGLLKLFCSGREHESVVGDLMEQYHQQGRGRAWYWLQVLDIVALTLYRKATRRPLVTTHRVPVGAIFAAILVVVALSAILVSPVWPLGVIAIGGGLLVGILRYERGPGRADVAQSPAPRVARIDSSKIPIAGGAGAGIVILTLFIAVLHDLPELRRWAMPGLVAGLVFAVGLQVWRRLHPRDIEKDWLSIKSK